MEFFANESFSLISITLLDQDSPLRCGPVLHFREEGKSRDTAPAAQLRTHSPRAHYRREASIHACAAAAELFFPSAAHNAGIVWEQLLSLAHRAMLTSDVSVPAHSAPPPRGLLVVCEHCPKFPLW
mmetsp:Transcript_29933/g.79743  ORF Transcript_29933/g.79743 Transcript_29933/m.79743 type:complete len:126 (-) Transcript_29933:54-431(-)